jgi:chemotaxis methyl-accepting protein methylase
MGTTTGIRIDMVAQDEPVEKLIAAAVPNVINGSILGVRTLEEMLTRYSAVCRSLQTDPMVQARTRMMQAITMDLTPFTQDSSAFSKLRTPFPTEIPIAVMLEKQEPQIRLA